MGDTRVMCLPGNQDQLELVIKGMSWLRVYHSVEHKHLGERCGLNFIYRDTANSSSLLHLSWEGRG